MWYAIAFWWVIVGIAVACFACFMGKCNFNESNPKKSYIKLGWWIVGGPIGIFKFVGPKKSIKDWFRNTMKSWLSDEAPATEAPAADES
jgi:hypothetical protein